MTPLRILQGTGNSLDTLPLARHEDVDGISADVYVHNGAVFAQPETPVATRVLRRAPFIGARIAARTEVPVIVPVADVFRAAEEAGRAHTLLLDLRTASGDPAQEIAVALHSVPDRSRLIVACASWEVAERLHAWLPDLRVALNLDSEGALRRYIQARMDGSLAEAPAIVRESLLHTEHEYASLRKRAALVGVRGVRTVERAQTLASWGVDLVMSESVGVLAALGG